MKRREFITGLGLAALVWSTPARAEPRRIGRFHRRNLSGLDRQDRGLRFGTIAPRRSGGRSRRTARSTARRLAEIGVSTNHIAAITGHASLAEVERYTKAANRKRMAREAMMKLIESEQ